MLVKICAHMHVHEAKKCTRVCQNFAHAHARVQRYLVNISATKVVSYQCKERCHAKFLEGHLNELGLLIGPNPSGRFVNKAV